METNLVEMKKITKHFGGVKALTDVDLDIKRGEIVCLLGENGAGKSTLMKVLTGVYPEYGGEFTMEGSVKHYKGTHDAGHDGIKMIFQELNLCPNLTVAENIYLGSEPKTKAGFINHKLMIKESGKFINQLGLDIDPRHTLSNLPIATQQMVEIIKALISNPKILIMDEPTSSLSSKEIEQLFVIMRKLKENGISIVFISHKLEEVMEITDRVVVLRDGTNIKSIDTKDANHDLLISLMVGRELSSLYTHRTTPPGTEVLFEVKGVSGPPMIKDASFKLHKGEILGFAGLVGAGRTELMKLIYGGVKKNSGEFYMNGKRLDIKQPADAVKAGIAYVPENRKEEAVILEMSIKNNLTMSIHDKVKRLGIFLDKGQEKTITSGYIDQLSIKTPSMFQAIKNLSGGNQQKVVLGKSLAIEPNILILDEPTRGIDVGAKAEVHRIITELADEGLSIILISSELPEVMGSSDRILVMHEGSITGEFNRDEFDQEEIMRAAVKVC
mgnify:CR=1 FL=1